MKMIWCGLKIKENYHVLVNQFQGHFRSKTLGCRKIKSVFRDVKWCFNASCGFKGLKRFPAVVCMCRSNEFTYISLTARHNVKCVINKGYNTVQCNVEMLPAKHCQVKWREFFLSLKIYIYTSINSVWQSNCNFCIHFFIISFYLLWMSFYSVRDTC